LLSKENLPWVSQLRGSTSVFVRLRAIYVPNGQLLDSDWIKAQMRHANEGDGGLDGEGVHVDSVSSAAEFEPRLARLEGARSPGYGQKITDLPNGGFRIESDREALSVRGVPYWEAEEPIRQLKREGRLDDAVAYLLEIVEHLERYDREWTGRRPPVSPIPPWYYSQLATIYRKQKRYSDEIAIIARFIALKPPALQDERFGLRAAKARALMERVS
jgi:tetratricopeptide (TPR) repeat protein